MKALMIYPDISSEKGIAKYSIDLIDNIRKQKVQMDEVTFIQGNPWTLFRQLPKVLGYDIIHVQHEYNLLGWYGSPYFLFFGILGLLKKKGLIITMHTVLSQNEKFSSGKAKTFLRKILYKLQNRWMNYTSSKIIVHADSFKEILKKEYSIKDEKIAVLPHALREDIKTVSKEQARRDLNIKEKNVYLLIGTMIPDHGHDVIIRQAEKIGPLILVATNPSAVNDRNENKIKDFLKLNQEIVRKNKLEKYVRFDLGEIPYEKWWKYYAAADIALLPYRGGIGSGIFADTMSMKKPAIASGKYFKNFSKKYGCVKVVEEDEDFSTLIKESIIPENYKKMQEECNRFFQENNLTTISKKYKKIYERLLR